MTRASFILYLAFTLFIISAAYGVQIQFFKNANFTGLLFESNSTGSCNNIPENKRDVVYSIRTDTCIIAYGQNDCNSIWSDKFMPGDTVLIDAQFARAFYIASFHICNEDEGGNQLNLDIIKFMAYSNPHPEVLESYKNLCACVNVPQFVQNMSYWSIDNHHNSLLAYYQPDCSVSKWNPEFIRAGRNFGSKNMHYMKRLDHLTNTSFRIQSFGPNPNSTYFNTSCLGLYPRPTTQRGEMFEY